jgi:hypothetical protein
MYDDLTDKELVATMADLAAIWATAGRVWRRIVRKNGTTAARYTDIALAMEADMRELRQELLKRSNRYESK